MFGNGCAVFKKQNLTQIRLEVSMAVTMKMAVIWD
jgi:hypothetical protein